MSHTKCYVAKLLVVSLAFAVAAANAQDKKPANRSSDQSGRYVIVISPTTNTGTYLLDTETGKVWLLVQYNRAEGEPIVWKFMDRLDTPVQFNEWVSQQRLKPPANQ